MLLSNQNSKIQWTSYKGINPNITDARIRTAAKQIFNTSFQNLTVGQVYKLINMVEAAFVFSSPYKLHEIFNLKEDTAKNPPLVKACVEGIYILYILLVPHTAKSASQLQTTNQEEVLFEPQHFAREELQLEVCDHPNHHNFYRRTKIKNTKEPPTSWVAITNEALSLPLLALMQPMGCEFCRSQAKKGETPHFLVYNYPTLLPVTNSRKIVADDRYSDEGGKKSMVQNMMTRSGKQPDEKLNNFRMEVVPVTYIITENNGEVANEDEIYLDTPLSNKKPTGRFCDGRCVTRSLQLERVKKLFKVIFDKELTTLFHDYREILNKHIQRNEGLEVAIMFFNLLKLIGKFFDGLSTENGYRKLFNHLNKRLQEKFECKYSATLCEPTILAHIVRCQFRALVGNDLALLIPEGNARNYAFFMASTGRMNFDEYIAKPLEVPDGSPRPNLEYMATPIECWIIAPPPESKYGEDAELVSGLRGLSKQALHDAKSSHELTPSEFAITYVEDCLQKLNFENDSATRQTASDIGSYFPYELKSTFPESVRKTIESNMVNGMLQNSITTEVYNAWVTDKVSQFAPKLLDCTDFMNTYINKEKSVKAPNYKPDEHVSLLIQHIIADNDKLYRRRIWKNMALLLAYFPCHSINQNGDWALTAIKKIVDTNAKTTATHRTSHTRVLAISRSQIDRTVKDTGDGIPDEITRFNVSTRSCDTLFPLSCVLYESSVFV